MLYYLCPPERRRLPWPAVHGCASASSKVSRRRGSFSSRPVKRSISSVETDGLPLPLGAKSTGSFLILLYVSMKFAPRCEWPSRQRDG